TSHPLCLKANYLTTHVQIAILSSLYSWNRIAVTQFATKPELLQTWTNNKEVIAKVLKTKLNSGKSSQFGDAIAAAADQFKETPPGTRHLVIITDGVDAPGGKVALSKGLKQLSSVQASVHIISYTALEREALKNQT